MTDLGTQAVIDVVVPTYNNLDELKRCLAGLETQEVPGLRVLVCVDGSTDGTLEYLGQRAHGVAVDVLEHADRRNHGRAAARNLALPVLAADSVLFLDSDMRLAPGAVSRHLELLGRQECVSVGDVVYLNQSENLWARYIGSRGKNKHSAGAKLTPTDFVTANCALHTAHLEAVGGFDLTLEGYGGEDTELAFRLVDERSLSIIFNPDARAETIEDKSLEQGLAELREFATVSLGTIRARHEGARNWFLVNRLESSRLRDRLFRGLVNPATDRLVDLLLRVTPFPVQRQLLNYKVISAVFAGYREGLARGKRVPGKTLP
jgi:glycosyltransferase involved in cell wall biosynthesis